MNKAERFRRLTNTDAVRGDLRGKSVRAAMFTGIASFGDFAIRLGSTAVLARLIIPEHFGLVMMVTAVTAIADQLKELGLSSATVQQKEITHEEVTNLFWVNVLVSAALALVVCGLAPLIAHYYREPRLLVITCALAANFVFGGLMVQHQALLTRQLKLGHTSMVRLLANLLSTFLSIGLAWMDFGYWALIWRELARSILLAAGMWFFCPWIPSLPFRNTDIRKLLGFGANLTGANILGTISAGIDRFLIGRFYGPASVGTYRQAYQLMAAPTDQLVSPIYQVSQPALSMLQTDDARYRAFYKKIVTMVCIITMPLSLFVAVYAREITLILLGKNWMGATLILQILSFGTFIKQAVGSSAQILITRGASRRYLHLTMLQNATMILFMCIGVKWGIAGVAVADVAVGYVLMWPRLHLTFKGTPVTMGLFFSAIIPPAAASGVMGLVLYFLRTYLPTQSLAISVGLGALIAPLVFFGTWFLLPTGRQELGTVVTDIRSGLQRRLANKRPDLMPAS